MINMILYVSENGQYYGNGMLLNIILYVAENWLHNEKQGMTSMILYVAENWLCGNDKVWWICFVHTLPFS